MDLAARKRDMADQWWRLCNVYQITDKDGRRLPFYPNWAQEALYREIWTGSLILKARQLGMSTFINLLMLDNCLFNPNYRAAVIAHEKDSAQELFDRNIRFPYEQLPEAIRNTVSAERDSVRGYKFSNGSGIQVGTSVRSGTFQFLHISEFGKICAKYPHKAREIVTGSLETVGQGNIIVIESTAEGAEGYFYDYCQTAQALADQKKPLTAQDFRFFFFPWWKHPDYWLSAEEALSVPITREDHAYFDRIEGECGATLSLPQRAWYVKKRERLGEDMLREYPSTPKEAFEQSLEGTYYAEQIAAARKQGRILQLPIDPRTPINTFWDIGLDDFTAIWFHQWIPPWHHFIAYLEASGEPLQYFANRIFEYRDRGYTLGTHYLPHDGNKRDIKDRVSYADAAEKLGLRPLVVVERTTDVVSDIQAVRDILGTCRFDEAGTAQGIKRLTHYRKEWNERMGCWSDRPRHDDNSHGADAARVFATGYRPPSAPLNRKKRHGSWRTV